MTRLEEYVITSHTCLCDPSTTFRGIVLPYASAPGGPKHSGSDFEGLNRNEPLLRLMSRDRTTSTEHRKAVDIDIWR
jgi:hypothetical protein